MLQLLSFNFSKCVSLLFYFLGACKKPYIALIDGITMGGVSIYIYFPNLAKSSE